MQTLNKLKAQNKKETLVDTLGLVSCALIVGSITDYVAGLRGVGILASRTYATAINIPTGGPYGKWRNFLYKKTKTTDESSRTRKYLVELLAFDTFQVPLYATVVGAGSLVSNMMQGEMKIDLDKIAHGTAFLTAISPLVSPTVGLYMEGMRKAFGLSSAPKKARESLEYKVE